GLAYPGGQIVHRRKGRACPFPLFPTLIVLSWMRQRVCTCRQDLEPQRVTERPGQSRLKVRRARSTKGLPACGHEPERREPHDQVRPGEKGLKCGNPRRNTEHRLRAGSPGEG